MDSLVGYIDRSFLAAIGGHVPSAKAARQAKIISATAAILPVLMDRFAINTADRINQFLAHITASSPASDQMWMATPIGSRSDRT